MAKTKTKEIIEKVLINPVFISLIVFLLATLVVYRLTITKVDLAYNKEFIRDILVEAHGMLFDILIIGTFIFALHILVESRREKKRNIQRWQEEIDDFRRWNDKEATFKIVGNIKRLNRNGISKINLSYCFLKDAVLHERDLRRADLWKANLKGAILMDTNLEEADLRQANLRQANLFRTHLRRAAFWRANLEGADLWEANFKEANFMDANLKGANFMDANLEGAGLVIANLEGAGNLTIEQLSKVNTLYQAKLDSELGKEIKEKYPHLLEEPEWMKEIRGAEASRPSGSEGR